MSLTSYKPIVKAKLVEKLVSMSTNEDSDESPEESIQKLVDVLVDELEAWLKAGVITVNINIPVVGAVTPAGAVSGKGTGIVTTSVK